MRRTLAALALGVVLAGCESTPQEAPPPVAAARPAPAPVSRPLPPRDACGAFELQHLVGRPRSEIPVPVDPSRQRVACTTCPVTQDFSPQRLNFFFDADSGLIRQIKCG